MWHWHGYGPDGWGIVAMTIGSLLILAVVAFLGFALSRYVSQRHQPLPGASAGRGPGGPGWPQGWAYGPSPEQVLAERFARGEIDAEEYRQRLETLRSVGGPGGGSPGGGSPGGGSPGGGWTGGGPPS
ncbi:SHOCT domain-containing protein, partial [Streptomyces sp. FH025]|uniref:SHOCT domain-containing protein n=1 Tax=Streptomyces sp. FH025 TaxID=2815937 RepID=UPI001A9F5785